MGALAIGFQSRRSLGLDGEEYKNIYSNKLMIDSTLEFGASLER